jgi:hypothetical protein
MAQQGSICAAPIKGTRMRIVKLDTCGVPVTGTSSLAIVTKGFVQVQSEPQYEDGEEFFERNADGEACVNQKDDPVLKRFETTIDFCVIDPTAAAYILSARDIVSGSPASGYGLVMSEGSPSNRFSLEVWQRVAGSGACDASGLQQYVYHAWPNLGSTKMGGYTIENGRSTFQAMSETRGAATQWGYGPGTGTKWLPSTAAVDSDGLDHYLWAITTTAPPAVGCGAQALS